MRVKKIAWLLLTMILCVSLFGGCLKTGLPNGPGGGTGDEPEEPQKTFSDGWYVLEQKTVDGFDATNEYIYNCIEIKGKTATLYEVDFVGKTEQAATVNVEGDIVNLLVGVKNYDYKLDLATDTLRYEGKVNRQTVVQTYQLKKDFSMEQSTKGVSFTGELFGEDLTQNFYNYCPTIMMEGNSTMHIWYCSNKDSSVVTDYVAYRKGTLNKSGKWEFSDKELVLQPTPNTWDLEHTCDPSVIKGKFAYHSEEYTYLMAYLGCKTKNNNENEVGIAVSKKPEGPWVKIAELNPIANFLQSSEHNPNYWGYGQPSLVSVDKEGKVLLFYTKGVPSGTFIEVEEWDLSNLNDAKKLRSKGLSNLGVVNASGAADVINNADFAYDSFRNRLYCIKEDFPYPTDGGVGIISASNVLMYIDLGTSKTFDVLFSGSPRWNVAAKLTKEGTGKFRNHNAGIVSDEYGNIINPFRIPIVYTMSDAATDHPSWGNSIWASLHTYRLYGFLFDVK